jgi:4-amino-4-deoxy-L-arabinose transferase-like glycosyltransferase
LTPQIRLDQTQTQGIAASGASQITGRPSFLDCPNGLLWVLAVFFPILVILCFVVPPFDDELYYWCWSEHLQLSYYDHPPMVAYLIRISTFVFGHSILAIRIPCIIAGLVVAGTITALSRPRDLVPAVLLSPVPTFAAVMITPDVPMLLFWSLYLVWLVKVHTRLSEGHKVPLWAWILGGILLGCGVLGKYTTGLAAVSGSLTFVALGRWRTWIVGYVLHALTSMLVASPILFYNLACDFAPVRYQWEHAMSSSEPGILSLLEFVGIQLVLFGSVPFIVFAWGLWRSKTLLADPRLRVCACLFLVPFAFFLYKATRSRLEGNWAFPCYLACWPLAAELYRRVKEQVICRRLTALAFALPLGTSLFFAIHSIVPIPFTPVNGDRPTRQWAKLEIAKAIADDLHSVGYNGPVYAPTYQWVSLLRWYGVDARQNDGGSRPSHFTSQPTDPIDPRAFVVFLEVGEEKPKSPAYGLSSFRVFCTHQMIVRNQSGPYLHIVDCSVPRVLPAARGRN